MPLSVIQLYKDVLPKTNCADCGVPTCMAFAHQVILHGAPLSGCPHLAPERAAALQEELHQQKARGVGVARDLAADALAWAKERATSLALDDLEVRTGGALITHDAGRALELPYFGRPVRFDGERVGRADGEELNRWEQVLLFNHLAQGGRRAPVGRWIGLEQVPNATSKVVSLRDGVETPLAEAFAGRPEALRGAAARIGGADASAELPSAELALTFRPLPRVPMALLFWDGDADEGFEARVKLLFDETVNEHLDLESIVFLAEQLRAKLEASPPA